MRSRSTRRSGRVSALHYLWDRDGSRGFALIGVRVAEIIDLKKKFEEDKEKIEKLKQSRKFKPY